MWPFLMHTVYIYHFPWCHEGQSMMSSAIFRLTSVMSQRSDQWGLYRLYVKYWRENPWCHKGKSMTSDSIFRMQKMKENTSLTINRIQLVVWHHRSRDLKSVYKCLVGPLWCVYGNYSVLPWMKSPLGDLHVLGTKPEDVLKFGLIPFCYWRGYCATESLCALTMRLLLLSALQAES